MYLGVASNELHGGKNGFSRGESFPARAEEQRLLSVRPEHNPEKSKSGNNPGRGDDGYCKVKVRMWERHFGERFKIRETPIPSQRRNLFHFFGKTPTPSKLFYFLPLFFNHSLRVLKVDQPCLPAIRQGGASLPGDLARLHSTLLLWPEHITSSVRKRSLSKAFLAQTEWL